MKVSRRAVPRATSRRPRRLSLKAYSPTPLGRSRVKVSQRSVPSVTSLGPLDRSPQTARRRAHPPNIIIQMRQTLNPARKAIWKARRVLLGLLSQGPQRIERKDLSPPSTPPLKQRLPAPKRKPVRHTSGHLGVGGARSLSYNISIGHDPPLTGAAVGRMCRMRDTRVGWAVISPSTVMVWFAPARGAG